MVLVGRVNKELVSLINQEGGKAVGLCGVDGNLITARPQGAVDVGFVGEVSSIDSGILKSLVESGYIPIVSSVASDETGQAYNINADTVAGEIAAALGAEKLILLTDTKGILKDYKDPSTLLPKLDIQQARQLIETGVVAGGMIPKVNCCVRSLAQGVGAAHILDGRVPHALLLEIFTDLGIITTTRAVGPALTRTMMTELAAKKPDVNVFELGKKKDLDEAKAKQKPRL